MSDLQTDEDLRTLPLRAIVAYATRAAQRSRPRLALDDSAASAIASIDEAIAVAASFASDDGYDADRAAVAESAIVEAIAVAGGEEHGDKVSALVATAAYAAVNAAIAAAAVPEAKSPTNAAAAVVSAALTAAESARAINTHARHGLARDFENLVKRARAPFPELGRAVDVGAKGPLGKANAKPVPTKKGPGPNEVDLLDILRMREEFEQERSEFERHRRSIDEQRLELAEARAELERERAEHVAESARLEGERVRARMLVGDLEEVLAKHGLDRNRAQLEEATDYGYGLDQSASPDGVSTVALPVVATADTVVN